MNASVITALAALAGAAIGGLTSVFASWLAQHAQARAQGVAQDKLRRQDLYKEFIEAASKCQPSRRLDTSQDPILIGCTPVPPFRWTIGLDDRMPGCAKMFCRVSIGRLIAATDMAAGNSSSLSRPGHSELTAIKAPAGCA